MGEGLLYDTGTFHSWQTNNKSNHVPWNLYERNWAYEYDEGRHGCDRMVVEFITTYMQSVPITTNVVSLNPAQVMCTLCNNMRWKFVSDLRQVGGFLWVLRFPPQIKLTATI
jgi:hypothetical protein